jgi:undecaprenyl-diphosphatase
MVHVATLIAVVIVFRKAIVEVFTTRRRLIPLYIIGCIPAGVAGAFLKLYGQDAFAGFKSSLICVGTAFIATGVILFLTRFIGKPARDDETVTFNDAVRIGVYQAAALLPGISRSGVTIGAGVMGGLTRSFAAQFSFVMAIPLILGAAAVDAKHLVVNCPISPGVLVVGFLAAFATGLLALFGLVAVVKRGKLWLFALYLPDWESSW